MTDNAIEPELVDVDAVPTAVIAGVVPTSELAAFFDRAFPTIPAVLAAQGLSIAGPAFARYHGPPADTVDIEVGFPTTGTVRPTGDVVGSTLPAGRVARLVHAGGYETLGDSWEQLRAWIDAHGLTATPTLWEVYVTEPSPDMDPADLRTECNWLLSP